MSHGTLCSAGLLCLRMALHVLLGSVCVLCGKRYSLALTRHQLLLGVLK